MTRETVTGTIQSDQKLFGLIELLKEKQKAGVTELAAESDLVKSTVHAHLKTLAQHGYVTKEDGEYMLGIRFFDLGIHARNTRPIYHVATPKLYDLAEESQENARCLIEENGLGSFLAGAAGKYSVKTDARIGTMMHLHCISGGKAILAYLPSDRVDQIVAKHGLPRRTPNTITDRTELLKELETVRQNGYALNLEESINGIHAVGTPIRNETGTVMGAISVSGAANRLTEERCKNEISELLLAVANEIELELTYARRHADRGFDSAEQDSVDR